MKIKLFVCGKLRHGPEFRLFTKYHSRAEKIGKFINVSPVNISEYDENKFTKFIADESFVKSFSSRCYKVLLDERGKNFSSNTFAELIRSHRDNGTAECIFFIGAADGVPASLRDNFDEMVSFGKMVWPHFLIRVMLMEQIYRASTILAGIPYHKE